MKIKSKLPHLGTTIFSVMSALANQHQAINLSQGFPNFDCEQRLKDLVGKYVQEGYNQYCPMAGDVSGQVFPGLRVGTIIRLVIVKTAPSNRTPRCPPAPLPAASAPPRCWPPACPSCWPWPASPSSSLLSAMPSCRLRRPPRSPPCLTVLFLYPMCR